MTENAATIQGFTRKVVADCDQYTLFLLVKPETEFDDRFKAWDMDEQEFIIVNGWLFTVEDAATEGVK